MRHPSSGHLDRVLEAMGQSCGLGPLQVDEQGQLQLALEPGSLTLLVQDLEDGGEDHGGHGLLLAVSARCDALRPDLSARLLRQADFRLRGTQPPRWIWNSGRLWVSIRLPHPALTPGELEQAIHQLCGELDAVADLV